MVESGEELGFLPGGIDEKIAPHIESFYNATEMFADRKAVEWLVASKELDFQPLAYMRGRTFSHKLVILDEAQNCDFRQLMLFITRLGKNSKMIILGDTSQYDIKENQVALASFIEMLKDVPNVATHEFVKSDIVREPILIEITERYEMRKQQGKVTKRK
jgi:phosphate starvation-inducible PhoH-like protein